jgi:hypothetical protein
MIIPQETADLSDDHRYCISRKLDFESGVEVVYCLDQPDNPYLKKVLIIMTASLKALDNIEHQAVIAVDQLFSRLLVTLAGSLQQLLCLLILEERKTRQTHVLQSH